MIYLIYGITGNSFLPKWRQIVMDYLGGLFILNLGVLAFLPPPPPPQMLNVHLSATLWQMWLINTSSVRGFSFLISHKKISLKNSGLLILLLVTFK